MTPEPWMLYSSAAFLLLVGCAPTTCAAPAASTEPAKAQITVLYDAFGKDSAMQQDWGYAALVEYGGKRILFDTGNNPEILARNAKAKNIDLSKLDFVVMSHRHGDHMGGLSHVLTVNPRVKIYAPKEGFGIYGADLPSTFYRKDPSLPPEQRYYGGAPPEIMRFGSAWPGANFQLVDKSAEVAPDIHLIALVSDKPGTLELRELSLAINTSDGMVIVVGCSHPGIDKIVEAATAINPRIHFIAGGLHLVVASDADIAKIVTTLHDTFKVEYVAPGHCTGEPAFTALRRAFGDHYLYAGLGAQLTPAGTPRSSSWSPQRGQPDIEGNNGGAGIRDSQAELNETPRSGNPIEGLYFPLQLEASSGNGCAVVRCSGRLIAATADFFKTEAIRRIDRGKIFTVDLTELTDVDGSGLRALFSVFSSAQQADCKFRVNMTAHVADLVQLTSLADLPKSRDDSWPSTLSSE
jgi:7,8-dihydropterin-6-yl-methyl-4-(beta-D-ribofuranosyl)aminobenzene 5'-phosphate synthase